MGEIFTRSDLCITRAGFTGRVPHSSLFAALMIMASGNPRDVVSCTLRQAVPKVNRIGCPKAIIAIKFDF